MRLTRDETRALTFVTLLLALSALARVSRRTEPVHVDAPALDVDTLVERAEAARAERERRGRPLAEGERIDPNTAPAVELDRLPGVGPRVAARIIAERDSGGVFRSTADLAERVAGIGPATARRIAPYVDLPAASARRASGPRRSPARLDLNRATAVQLRRLPGVGPVIAGRIVAYRDSAGGFGTVDELASVAGIGPRTLERLRPHLRVTP